MIPVWFDSDSVCFFLSTIHSHTIHIDIVKRPLFRCVSHIRCACGLLLPLLLLPYVCCVYVCIGNSEYNVFIFDLVNCWLHAKQHRMLYGPRIRISNFLIPQFIHMGYRFVCILWFVLFKITTKYKLCDWFFCSGHTHAWHFEFCSFNLMYHLQRTVCGVSHWFIAENRYRSESNGLT